MTVEVTVTTTPNENALKFTLDCQAIESGYKTYADSGSAGESPVAKAVFAINGVAQVFLMADFVTVTKKPESQWSDLQEPIVEAIKSSY